MEIKTKYSINQKVFWMQDNKVVPGKILRISTSTIINHGKHGKPDTLQTTISYLTDQGMAAPFLETELFGSKEELLASL
jgi:hypothetical protein